MNNEKTSAAPSPDREQVGEAAEAALIVKMWDDGYTQLAGKRAVEMLRNASPSRECGEPFPENLCSRNKIAAALHYPDHWDTAAYPTLDDAVWEAIAAAKLTCSECGERQGVQVELPERVIDKLFQAAAVSTCGPDGEDILDNLHAFARNVVAETLARLPASAPTLSDSQILEIGYRHFKPGHNVKAEANFVAAVRDVLAASAPTLGEKPQAAEPTANQCDGCAVDAPLTERGNHAMPDGGYMGCTKDRYVESKGLTDEPPRLWSRVLTALRKTGIEWRNAGWVFPSDDALHNFARALLSKGE